MLCLIVLSVEAQTLSHMPARRLTPSDSLKLNTNVIVLPEPLSDPLEPFNRAVWSLNKGLMKWLFKPASTGYRFVVPKPARKGIGNVGRNLAFPVRFINEFLQGNWNGMGDETARCLCNTIFGLGGIFDVATRGHIPKRDADFGQTFKKWGCQPGIFLMLPILGPSDIRDGSGLIGDFAANPMTYFFPYSYVSPGVTANNFSDNVDEGVRFNQVEPDSYSILQYAWTFTHENRSR